MKKISSEQRAEMLEILTLAGVIFEADDMPPGTLPHVNLNDALYWGCADGECVSDDADLDTLHTLWIRYGWCGVLYWAVHVKRGGDVGQIFPRSAREVAFVKTEEEIRAAAATPAAAVYARATHTATDASNGNTP